jgi:hypothetical protein
VPGWSAPRGQRKGAAPFRGRDGAAAKIDAEKINTSGREFDPVALARAILLLQNSEAFGSSSRGTATPIDIRKKWCITPTASSLNGTRLLCAMHQEVREQINFAAFTSGKEAAADWVLWLAKTIGFCRDPLRQWPIWCGYFARVNTRRV